MATKILLKKSVTGGASPLTSDLDQGELAINLVDRKIYTKNSANAITEISGAYVDSSAPSNPVEGDLWYDTANNLLKAHNGTGFVSAGYQNLSDLEDVTLTSIASGDYLKWNGTAFVNSSLETDVIADVQGNDLDMGSNTITTTGAIKYSNVYSTEGDLPSASTYHGMFAHVHATGKGYYAHGGNWIKLLDETSSSTSNLSEGTNLYHTNERVDDRVAALIVGGTNLTATYDDVAGTLTLDAAAAGGYDLSGNNTDDVDEGTTNLYHTTARARAAISVTDAGGDGSAAYNSTTGVITYTGPSAAEVRAHHTAGTGVTIASGEVAIGQAVATTDNVTFNKVTTSLIEGGSTITLDPAGLGDNTGTVVIAGDLTVNGTTTSVNSNEVNIGDSIILLNSDEAGTPSQNGGIEIERGTSANVSFVWNEADDKWDLNNEELQNVTLDGGSY